MIYSEDYLSALKSSSIHEFTCSQCYKIFTRKVSDVKRRLKNSNQVRVYCSTKCSGKRNVTRQNVCCLLCNKQFTKTRYQAAKFKNHFCSSSCSATFNNKFRKKFRLCTTCNNEILNKGVKYCSKLCRRQQYHKENIERFKQGKMPNRRILRKILGEIRGEKCSMCSNTHWLGKPILLIVDHISGHSSDDRPENLRLICSNCDATLPTYKARNKGKGRASRRKHKKHS